MKRIGWLVLALGLLALTGCGGPAQAEPTAFDALARWVPGDAEQPFFLDLKPDGEAGQHWERIRRQLEADPMGQEALQSLLSEFRIEELGLDEFIVGPAVNGYGQGRRYVIVQVSDEKATEDALLQHVEGTVWEQEEYQGRTLYYGWKPISSGRSEQLAWAVADECLFLVTVYDSESLPSLKALLDLAEEDSLAALPAWRTLRERLPREPMGLVFFNIAEQTRQNPPSPSDTSPAVVLGQQIEAIALAAMPERDRMRVEIEGVLAKQADDVPELRALFDLPPVEPTTWTALPADAAIALLTHDASTVWPWIKDLFSLNVDALDQLRAAIGLDLEADLLSEEGPPAGDFALAVTPPLPDQPIMQGLTAAQLLIAARGATEAQADGVRTAMEGRGAVFGPGEVEGVAIQTQVGTELSGYAVSYGFHENTLLLGSSPDVIGQAVAAQRAGQGMVGTRAFQAVLESLPDDATFVVYIHSDPLKKIAQANLTEEEYQNREDLHVLEPFEAIGLGLRFQPDRVSGVITFLMRE